MQEIQGNKKTMRSIHQKKALMNRLKRLEGQIRGIEKMVEEDAYCNDILQQSMAAGSAIDGFNQELLGFHMKGCVTEGIKNGDEEIVDELLKTMRKLMK
ncbi:MAG: metal-sensing transcriptional repressor [Clostridia bacterium]|nr:metal-sensing transcriptional repressor [Clostridia bacterium]